MIFLSSRASRTRLAVSLLLAYVPPLASYFVLDADGPLLPLLAYIGAVVFLSLLRLELHPHRLPTLLLAVALVVGAIVVYAGLDITPASAYSAWFEMVGSGQAGGSIAYLFSTDVAYFSALFAGLLLAVEPLTSLVSYLFVNLFIAAVVARSTVLVAISLAAVAGFTFLRALRHSGSKRRGPAVAAAQVLTAAILLALALTPAKPPNALVDALFSIDLGAPIARAFPNFPFLYNVPGYGHSFGRSDRGGRPTLTSRPVFEVTASPGETLYLRNAVYDSYTGSGWDLSKRAREEAEATAGHSEPRGNVPVNAPGRPAPIRIKVLIDFIASLPNTLDTAAIVSPAGALPPLKYGSRATGYVLSVPISRGSVILDLRYSRDSGGPEHEPLSRLKRSDYLQTGDVSPRVRSLARELQRPTVSATVAAIRSYLADKYSYSLNPSPYPPNTDAVADFLFGSRTGYCVQFATAFTLLARLDGIPARYVTGYLVNLPNRSATSVVTGLSAHAWSEVWIAGRGWETVEATPPMMPSRFREAAYYSVFDPTGSSFTRKQLEAVMGARIGPPPKPPAGSSSPLLALVTVAVLAAAAAFALAAAALLLRGMVLALLPLPIKIRRTAARLARCSLSVGEADPARIGWHRWGVAVGRRTGRTSVGLRAAQVILELSFAGREPRRRDLRFLRGVDRLIRRLRRRNPPTLHPGMH